MADYWVSNPRYFCKYCKVWLADNKVQRQQHNSGPKHRAAVEALVVAQHERNKARRSQEQALSAEVARVSAAATASHQMFDLSTESSARRQEVWDDWADGGYAWPEGTWKEREEETAQLEVEKREAKESMREEIGPKEGYPAPCGYGEWEDVEDEKDNDVNHGPGADAKKRGKGGLPNLLQEAKSGVSDNENEKYVNGGPHSRARQQQPTALGAVKDIVFKKRTRNKKNRRKR